MKSIVKDKVGGFRTTDGAGETISEKTAVKLTDGTSLDIEVSWGRYTDFIYKFR